MGDENSRIETLDKQLAALLRKATVEQRRAAALAICSLAAHRTKLDDSRVDVAREALAGGTVGDCPERETMVKLAIEWDEQAWAVQETDAAEYQRAFAKARAAAGFESAFDPDSYVAAGEAAYEASYAIGDAETVRVAVAKILS